MLPSFLCIGVQKAATTWLYMALRQHSAIWMPPIKELHLFDSMYFPDNREWAAELIDRSCKTALLSHISHSGDVDLDFARYITELGTMYKFTEKWYKNAFDRPAAFQSKAAGEITPEYCIIPEDGVQYARQLLGNIKIIVVVRDPVDRALSQIRMHVDHRLEASSIEHLMDFTNDWVLTSRGDYLSFIPRWQKYFPSQDFLFIPYRRIGAAPLSVLRGIESFLDVGPYQHYEHLSSKIHVTKEYVVPAKVYEQVVELCAPQYEFLKDNFSAEFMGEI